MHAPRMLACRTVNSYSSTPVHIIYIVQYTVYPVYTVYRVYSTLSVLQYSVLVPLNSAKCSSMILEDRAYWFLYMYTYLDTYGVQYSGVLR